ncbi:hypothetical protein DNTS_032385 [Danionella cerebrum]|uniref:G-protein coupled receptors family 1 profile domain-containing protein n=1 Tax=Danionella cerebrum TaxID=2873325 RepID=A0A553PX01_9TELE|nr:hypothetical protein DNTS_032385 [Danionella translucida]
MLVSNQSALSCRRASSALCLSALEGHLDASSPYRTLSPTGHVLVAVSLGFIGTFGFLNNLLVLVLFCRYKVLRSPINFLLVNICLSDLLVCVLGTPFSFAASTQGRWLIGERGCVWYGFANSLFERTVEGDRKKREEREWGGIGKMTGLGLKPRDIHYTTGQDKGHYLQPKD